MCSLLVCLHQKLRENLKSFFQQSLIIVARTILNFRAVSDVNKPTMNTVCSHLLTYTLLKR